VLIQNEVLVKKECFDRLSTNGMVMRYINVRSC